MKKEKMHFIILTEANFQAEVLESERPVLVEFFANWCGSCHIIAPVLEEMETTFKSRVKFCQVDVDHQGKISNSYGVQKIPTILFFKNGQIVDYSIGIVPRTVIVQKLHALL